MSFLNPTVIVAFLEAHTVLAYGVLFLGAYAETVIGIGFFVYGELFFLPGAILAGAHILNILFIMLALYLGGICGDSTSYAIGRHFGAKLFKEEKKFFNPTNYAKGEKFFDTYGPKSIFLARLMGPFSWVTPFLAGIFKIPYRVFLAYNVPGVIVGIGQFIVVGYVFGSSWNAVLSFVQTYVEWVIGAIVVLYVAFHILERNAPEVLRLPKKFFRALARKIRSFLAVRHP